MKTQPELCELCDKPLLQGETGVHRDCADYEQALADGLVLHSVDCGSVEKSPKDAEIETLE